ncbi:MAG: phosphopantothenoylcysteine decarboxylase [Gemmataceae bacterium]|nr:phosphopantothenoylcysteine decarboxylase [Gemmataceae bacterium]
MSNILLGVTGSVAAIYTPELFDELRGAGHHVKVAATRASLYFFEPARLAPRDPSVGDRGVRNSEVVVLDEDEWPGPRYQRDDPVLHIELRRWADVLVIAPLDANTLAKLALGICDNCLTCVYRAWDRSRPVVLAPAMNTLMWEHPATARHLAQIAGDLSGLTAPAVANGIALAEWINANTGNLTIVPPVVKALACADVGMGAMAGRAEILAAVKRRFSA